MEDAAEVIDTLSLDFGPFEKSNRWKKMPDCDEFVGAKRSKHTIVAWSDALYVFGGDNGKRMLNDMLRFDIKECSWSRAVTKGAPPAPRYHHSAVIYGQSMLIFGGYTGDLYSNSNLQNKNDLFEYRFNAGQWIEWNVEGRSVTRKATQGKHDNIYPVIPLMWKGEEGKFRLFRGVVQQYGDRPPTCCNFPVAVARDSMFVFSGQSGAKITNDMFQFSFKENRWSLIPAAHLLRGSAPPPQRRYGHTMVAYDRHLYVYGGVADNALPADLHRFDLDDQTWDIVQPSSDNQLPTGRLFHAGVRIDDAFFIFGGTIDNNVRSGELYRFQLVSYPRCTLRDDFGRLLGSQQFCDMVFVVGEDDKIFPAHTALVAARSPWLRRHLLHLKETIQGSGEEEGQIEIRLHDAHPRAFEITLHYMYTDSIYSLVKGMMNFLMKFLLSDVNGSEAISLMMDVYGLAVKLEIGSFEHLCVQYIEASITQDNVLVALERAARLQLESLKEFCLRFIVREANYSSIIMSKEFESVPRDLMVDIIRRRQAHPQEYSIPLQFTITRTLEQAMTGFLCSGQDFHDITLKVDGNPVGAHKAILAARCSYFEAMFRSFMPENNIVTITIGETVPSQKAFDSLLKYIYFGNVTMPPEDSLYLLSAPFFFGFTNNRLQAFCKENLEKNVSFQNVVEILEAASTIGAVDMKKHALDIIVHNFPKIARSSTLRSLNRETLLEILDAIADYMNEMSFGQNSL
ncbi:predicted protein [Nematostella vectensis]|uniref:BTB domain-containing protein n=1 Tax=Nematostella vectensis TaxID=45351 RepID=A7RWH7_NEMVE|nr:predicted protein [Nematostella vectensis]|eukprot:XP_001636233.1 predicted protein [Nematostella vectensis]